MDHSFQISEMFDQVQAQALAGPVKDLDRFILKPLLYWFSCVFCVSVVLCCVER